MSDTGKVGQLKERVRSMIIDMGEVHRTRALACALTKLEEATMWIDYDLRSRGVDVQREVPVQPQESAAQAAAEAPVPAHVETAVPPQPVDPAVAGANL